MFDDSVKICKYTILFPFQRLIYGKWKVLPINKVMKSLEYFLLKFIRFYKTKNDWKG